MRPMSLFESGESNGTVSLGDLFGKREEIWGENKITLEEMSFLACRGGWPQSAFLDQEAALESAFDYARLL